MINNGDVHLVTSRLASGPSPITSEVKCISLSKLGYHILHVLLQKPVGNIYVYIFLGSIYMMLVNIMHLSMSSLITEECRRQTGSANPLTYNDICSQEFA